MGGATSIELDPPTPIMNQENAPETCSQAKLMESILQLRFILPKLTSRLAITTMVSLKSTVLTQREGKVLVRVKKSPVL